jgi:hypothetical protein
MNRPLPLALRGPLAGAVLIASACASGPLAQAPGPAAPEGDPNPMYPGRCSFMRLEAVERPSPARGLGPDNRGSGSLELVATYRPGAGDDDTEDDDDKDSQPLAYSFQVSQERVDDLRAHLQQNPVILCRGESTGGNMSGPEPQGPSFEGQFGKPVTPGAEPSPPPQP